MTWNLVTAGIAGVLTIILLVFWKLGRAVLLESLSHPLRTAVITIDSSGGINVQAANEALVSQSGTEKLAGV